MLTFPVHIINIGGLHTQILAPLPIGFAVFLVHLATIPITGTGINPARSLGAAIIYNRDRAWDDHVSLANAEIRHISAAASSSRSNQSCMLLINCLSPRFLHWCSGFSGWDRSSGQRWQLSTTKWWSEPCLSNPSDCGYGFFLKSSKPHFLSLFFFFSIFIFFFC